MWWVIFFFFNWNLDILVLWDFWILFKYLVSFDISQQEMSLSCLVTCYCLVGMEAHFFTQLPWTMKEEKTLFSLGKGKSNSPLDLYSTHSTLAGKGKSAMHLLLPLWPLLTLWKKQATLPVIRDEVPAPHNFAWSTSLQPGEGGGLGSPFSVCWLGWG